MLETPSLAETRCCQPIAHIVVLLILTSIKDKTITIDSVTIMINYSVLIFVIILSFLAP